MGHGWLFYGGAGIELDGWEAMQTSELSEADGEWRKKRDKENFCEENFYNKYFQEGIQKNNMK